MICEEVISQREKDMLVNRVDDHCGLVECFTDHLTYDELYNFFTRQCNVFQFIEGGVVVAVVFLLVDGDRADIHLAKFKPCNTKRGLKALWGLIGHQVKTLHSYITLKDKHILRFWKSLGFEVETTEDGYYTTLKQYR